MTPAGRLTAQRQVSWAQGVHRYHVIFGTQFPKWTRIPEGWVTSGQARPVGTALSVLGGTTEVSDILPFCLREVLA